MAPEVFGDKDDRARYSMPADIYSFGLLTWSVIVHKPGEILSRPAEQHAVHLPELTVGEVQALQQVIERMIHSDPSKRYKAKEACNALNSIKDGSFTSSMPIDLHIPPPATGLSGAQAGSHIHLSDADNAAQTGLASSRASNDPVSGLPSGTSSVAESMMPQTDESSQAGVLISQLEGVMQPRNIEPQRVDSTSQESTPPTLRLPDNPSTSRPSMYRSISVPSPAQPEAGQDEVFFLQRELNALTVTAQTEATSVPRVQAEKTQDSLMQTEAAATPTQTVPTEGTQDPLVQTEATPTPAVEAEQTQGPLMKTEATPKPTVPAEQTQDPVTKTEATPTPTVLAEQTQDPLMQTESTPMPTVEAEQTQDPYMQTESTAIPTVQSEQTEDPLTKTEETPTPAVPAEQTQGPVMKTEPTPTPAVPAKQTQDPLGKTEATPTPAVPAEQTQDPLLQTEATPTPAVPAEQTQGQVTKTEATPTPAVPAKQTQDPLLQTEATPTPAVEVEQSQDPLLQTEATPTAAPTTTKEMKLNIHV